MSKPKILELVNQGDFKQARSVCLKACKKTPDDPELWYLLSAICGQQQDYPSAEKYCRKTLQLNESVPNVHFNLAIALRGQGKNDAARRSLEKVLALQPEFPQAILELANIELIEHNYPAAISNYERVIGMQPDAFQAYVGLARCHQQAGCHDQVIELCERFLRHDGVPVELNLLCARSYDRLGKHEEALAQYESASNKGVDAQDVLIDMGRMQAATGDLNGAEKSYLTVLASDDDSIEAHVNIALLYTDMHQIDKAVSHINKARLLKPADVTVLYNTAKVMESAGRYVESAKLYEQVRESGPDMWQASLNLGNLYLLSGRISDAIEVYRATYEAFPDYHEASSNWLLSLNYSADILPQQIFESHVTWGKIEEGGRVSLVEDAYVKEDGEPLKVGYISPDFRNHSVAYFIECVLKNADNDTVENVCFSDVTREDEVTRRFRSYANRWHDVRQMSDGDLIELIKAERIDVLVDLCGHVAGNRLTVFAAKPAPVQLTYLGYPNTTGLSRVDYRLVDAYTDPLENAPLSVESIYHLSPCFLCYTPHPEAPPVSVAPFKKNGYITFGSFNNLAKITDTVIDTWVALLDEVDGSRLRIKARQFSDPDLKELYRSRFTEKGVDPERVELLSYSRKQVDHLLEYHHIDIALDSFPYNGTTTTFESLWMGVPVITLKGEVHASRVSYSILQNMKLENCVAEDIDDYVSKASALAKDGVMLTQLRSEMRQYMSDAGLIDGKRFTRSFEAAILKMYRDKTG